MSAVKDLSTLPIGTKIEMIDDGEVVHTLHTTSVYENFQYLLVDENQNKYALTIKELMWGSYEIHLPESAIKESPVPRNSY